MKKILSLILVLVFALTCFVACGDNDGDNNGTDNTGADNGGNNGGDNGGNNGGDNGGNNGGNNGGATANSTYKLAIAIQSVEISARGGAKKLGTNVGVVVFAADGKIVDAAFDSIEINAPTLSEGAVVAQDTASKVESNYKKGGMAATWGEEANAFVDNFLKGKTAAEVAAAEIGAEDFLVTGCTMKSTSYSSMLNMQALVAMAAASEHTVTFEAAGEFNVGTAIDLVIAKNRTGDKVEVTADAAGAVVKNGVVIASIIDTSVQTYSIDGETVTFDGVVGSKRAQGDAYDASYPMAGGRWYAQVDTFAATANGKTVAQLEGLDTDEVAGCTINVDAHKVVLIAAATNAAA